MKRNLRIILIAAIMTLAMCCPAFAAITPQAGTDIALKDAGLTADQTVGLEAEMEKGRVEVEFTQKNTLTEYEYTISSSGKILEKEVEFKYTPVKSKKKISKTKARKAVVKASGVKYKKIRKGSCKYSRKHGVGYYKLRFRSGSYKYEYKLLAKTGKIIEYELDYRK